jgi:hypothetical protein
LRGKILDNWSESRISKGDLQTGVPAVFLTKEEEVWPEYFIINLSLALFSAIDI